MAREWFLKHEGKEHGPYTDGQLITLARDGSIARATPVRQGASDNWIQASTVPGLFSTSRKAPASAATASAAPAPNPVYRAQPVSEPTVAASRPSPKSKFRTPLLVGGAVGCVLLVAVVVAFVMRPGTKGVADAQEKSAHKVAAPNTATPKGTITIAPLVKLPTAQVQTKVSEITWKDALARFGKQGDPEKLREAFIPIRGATMQVSGVVKKTDPRVGSFDLGRDDHPDPILVRVQDKDRDFHQNVRVGDRVEIRGRLVDYPGIISPFTVNDAEYVRDKCVLSRRIRTSSVPLGQEATSDPKSHLYSAPLRAFDEHPEEILDAIKKGSTVWLLVDCAVCEKPSPPPWRYATYLVLENDTLVRVAKKRYTPDNALLAVAYQIEYTRFNVGHDVSGIEDKSKEHILKWQWIGGKKGNEIEAKDETEFTPSDNLVQHISTSSIIVDTVNGTWTETSENFMRLKKSTRDFPDGIIRNVDKLFGKAERVTK